jgi:F0F1-type ATP synthase assembly protein I
LPGGYYGENAMRRSADLSYEERRNRAVKILAAVSSVVWIVMIGIGVAVYRSTASWGWVFGVVLGAAFVLIIALRVARFLFLRAYKSRRKGPNDEGPSRSK